MFSSMSFDLIPGQDDILALLLTSYEGLKDVLQFSK